MIDAAKIAYSAKDLSKWLEGANPGDTDDVFNQIGIRLTWDVTGIKTASYTALDREIVRVDPS